ncbi:MAG: ATPase involved in chromosome partitioning [Solidesulfovibrio magneticus str. Maddingley MBC34]|uniref:ATPase involved in chromosome partitioning n=1 Tax=Solidesulfovibrio magneticus str. Maddingley MBC34 TaxID=1206767 RepID=K6HBZ7_9BACT|nr:MAG: ATPase involved in chromosome partitioning [Solidesulfovibrio magneticus str. Maddingley MBC34]
MDVSAAPGPRIIACCNHKGGVGKTTCTVNLAAGLSRSGWRVLALDADPQAHLTASLGLAVDPEGGLSGLLDGRLGLDAALIRDGELAVLPASAALAGTETQLAASAAPTDLLASYLASATGHDVVLIDCPPHLGQLAKQALYAATDILIPMTPDYLAMQSLAWLMDTLAELAASGDAPAVAGVVLNRFAAQKRLHREVKTLVEGHFPGMALAAVIRENVALAEAPSFGQDIFRYAPRSAGAADFAALAAETAARLRLPHPATAGGNP